jgi:F-type H+-transporting ATPase subunit epsilon
MPHTKFRVEILTPEGEVFNDEVEMVSTRTTVGEIGVLANHAPVLGMLEPTELRVYRSDDEVLRFAQSEGYMQIGGNHAMLLVQDIQTPEQLDASLLRERLAEAERELEAAGEDTERRRNALRDQKRWQAFLRVAEGS